ncbi:hypothetical protein P3L10_000490 [Capsicum annuum]
MNFKGEEDFLWIFRSKSHIPKGRLSEKFVRNSRGFSSAMASLIHNNETSQNKAGLLLIQQLISFTM